MNINLYREIVEILEEHNKSINDIVWIGTKEATIDIERFLKITKETEYDNGHGSSILTRDLIIVGDDWWLSRDEYDGAEWWRFNVYPQEQKVQKPICGITFDITGDTLFGESK